MSSRPAPARRSRHRLTFAGRAGHQPAGGHTPRGVEQRFPLAMPSAHSRPPLFPTGRGRPRGRFAPRPPLCRASRCPPTRPQGRGWLWACGWAGGAPQRRGRRGKVARGLLHHQQARNFRLPGPGEGAPHLLDEHIAYLLLGHIGVAPCAAQGYAKVLAGFLRIAAHSGFC